MIETNFLRYKQLREADENVGGDDTESGALGLRVTLGDGNNYKPFIISDDPKSEHYGKNRNLADIVRAFKQGANWGWSKDDASGEDKPVKISGKKLYLTGGALRDHLAGKTPRNSELVTNASPDEVYHILAQNGFDFMPSADQLPKGKGKHKTFWVKKKSKSGRPFGFGVRVGNEEFDLDVFTKTDRGAGPDADLESGTHAEDASSRDFTINGMYLLLSNHNGPNKEIHDFYGGMHHLAGKKINTIGNMIEKFTKNPKSILKFVRMVNNYGDPKNISEEDKKSIKKCLGGIKKMKKDDMMDEFKRGIDKDGVDARKLLQTFSDLGILQTMFPDKSIDTNFPKELSELGDKHMPLAWMFRAHDPKQLEDTGLDPDDLKKICFLIKSLGLTNNIDPHALDDLTQGFMTSGISSRKLKDWGARLGGIDDSILDAFINHAKSPRVRVYLMGDDGKETISDDFSDLVDPFTGKIDKNELGKRKREREHENFRKHMRFMRLA
jgi:tRNA nucleotidyltransferase/poly(A) polymerase